MRPINIRIRHNDDFVISEFLNIKIFTPYTGSQRGNQRTDFIR